MIPSQLPASDAQPQARGDHVSHLSAAEQSIISLLRMSALRCRAAARADLFEACALLTLDPQAAKLAYADVLVKTLREVLGKQPVFFRPRVAALSFDESWILSLIRAHARSDQPSFRFLIDARVSHHSRRSIAFLVTRLSEGIA